MGYQEYLKALADPTDERHDELFEWRGPFDSDRFELAAVNRKLSREFKPRQTRAKDR